jgi:hypothetical protein
MNTEAPGPGAGTAPTPAPADPLRGGALPPPPRRAEDALARALADGTLPPLPADFAARSAQRASLRVAAERRLQRRFRATLIGAFALVCGVGVLLGAGVPGLGSFLAQDAPVAGQDWLLLVGALLALHLVALRGR